MRETGGRSEGARSATLREMTGRVRKGRRRGRTSANTSARENCGAMASKKPRAPWRRYEFGWVRRGAILAPISRSEAREWRATSARRQREARAEATTISSTSVSACRMHGSTNACSDARPTKAQTPWTQSKKATRSEGSRSLRKVMRSGSRRSLVFWRCMKTARRVMSASRKLLTEGPESASVMSCTTRRETCSCSAASSAS
mmetsp:Transcript_70783/g.212957  ORF Transcript_70783/g.212957 Transcript_70783/m.212957 type:complete len:202 (+) Transcript_70783:86-691(+)